MHHKHFDKLKVEELEGSEAQITGEITLPFLVECRKEALKSLNKNVKLAGFRAGHIPEDVLVKQIGEMAVLEETAEVAIGREYGRIIEETKLSVIGRPEVSITKLAPGVPLEFKIKVYLEPKFDLPNYKKIASGEKADAVLEGDELEKKVEETLEELKQRDFKPQLNEGEKLEDKIRENLIKESEYRTQEKRRLKIIEALVKATEVKPPKVLVESEIMKMLAQFKDDLAQSGLKWEDYLKEVKKTEEDIKSDWRSKAEDRVKAELVIIKIAEAEKIEPEAEEVEHQAKHLMEHYPEADPLRARIHTYTHLRNQKVLEFLEKQAV
jgi:FKBP-type peptidyl-prolyl cis-trans isomerase (trigger factor)